MAFNSWPVYRRPEIHWAAVSRYRADDAWVQSKFFIRLAADSAVYGFYTERSDEPADPRVDWQAFLNWLAVGVQVVWLHQALAASGMWIFDPYPDFDGAFNRSIRPHNGGWLVDRPGSASEFIHTAALGDYLTAVDEGPWLNLMIGRKRPSNELLLSGVNVAVEIAADFNALLPLYLNQPPQHPQQHL